MALQNGVRNDKYFLKTLSKRHRSMSCGGSLERSQQGLSNPMKLEQIYRHLVVKFIKKSIKTDIFKENFI